MDPGDREQAALAAGGSYGSVAFFGLSANGTRLLAAGHNGLYRIDSTGAAEHQRWPRFIQVGGVFLSFALPDVILVMTELNRRASMAAWRRCSSYAETASIAARRREGFPIARLATGAA